MKEEESMNQYTHACIAYIACRLISGRRITSLYNIASSSEIDIPSLPDSAFLREFDEQHKDYIPGYASECSCRITSCTGKSIEIFINERTFIVHLQGSSAYFIGNIQRETIYLYDHKGSAHFRYRISGYQEDREKALKTGAHNELSADGIAAS